ncbi:MAG TPA: hypothetical protein VGI36_18810 [Candidatus Binataceae bacterium]|jgi:hypothetical protein
MKAIFNLYLLLVVVVMTGQPGSVALCQEQGSAHLYNQGTETTIKGTVEEVKTAYLPGGGASAQAQGQFSGPIYLNLKADSGTFRVYLGPSSFLESKSFKFAKGDQIEVTGSKLPNGDAIIAREVKRGDQVLVLRNAQGIPQWAEGR